MISNFSDEDMGLQEIYLLYITELVKDGDRNSNWGLPNSKSFSLTLLPHDVSEEHSGVSDPGD